MGFNVNKIRRNKLINSISLELTKNKPDINNILQSVDEYEKNNIDTIVKLRKNRLLDIRKINGALKQTINSHGPITKILIGSASKRIYGSLLTSNYETFIQKIIKKFLKYGNKNIKNN